MTQAGGLDAAITRAAAAQRQRRRLAARGDSLDREATQLEELVAERRKALTNESKDVARLERLSLSSIVSMLQDSRATDLERERAEQQAAEYVVAEAEARHRQVLTERERCRRALAALGDPDADLTRALADKEAAVRASGGAAGNRLSQLAQAVGARRAEAREVDEALTAGNEAQAALHSAADLLSSARSWSAYDTFAGGGLISSVVKHDRLDQAGATMRQADAQLARFTRELADVDLNGVGPVGVSGTLRGFDILFDNIISDLMVRSRILDAAERVDQASARVGGALASLRAHRAAVEADLTRLTAAREDLLRPRA